VTQAESYTAQITSNGVRLIRSQMAQHFRRRLVTSIAEAAASTP
jgi:hypothetical protein